MKCPLLMLVYASLGDENFDLSGTCLKEECAWWEVETKKCSILLLAQTLYIIKDPVDRLSKRIYANVDIAR